MATKTFTPADYPQVVAEHNTEALGLFGRVWSNLENRFGSWRAYRETVNELERLNDRELEDIGIMRADIRRIARHNHF